jgi:hypothetical protein
VLGEFLSAYFFFETQDESNISNPQGKKTDN